jgi:hypothetical protein
MSGTFSTYKEGKKIHRILVAKFGGKRPLGRPRNWGVGVEILL